MFRKTALLPLSGLVVIALVSLGAWAGDEQEEKVTLDQVPAAVKATILAEAAGAKIKEIERETKDGEIIYEAEFMVDGEKVEIAIAPDGTLLSREIEGDDEDDEDDDHGLRPEDVPAPARAALRKLADGAKILKVEREQEHGAVLYEAEWMVKGTKHEAAVTEDGALVEMEEVVRLADLPPAVRAAMAKHFPPNAKVQVEKKMIVVYEVAGRVDGKEKEILVFPTGRVQEGEGDDDDGNHHADKDDDDDDDGGDDEGDDD
jgi:uncharacterized membrane protein YkoI